MRSLSGGGGVTQWPPTHLFVDTMEESVTPYKSCASENQPIPADCDHEPVPSGVQCSVSVCVCVCVFLAMCVWSLGGSDRAVVPLTAYRGLAVADAEITATVLRQWENCCLVIQSE